MRDTEQVLGLVGMVVFHLFCPYHGEFSQASTAEEANQAALNHIVTQHADSEGKVAPGAEVHVTTVTHVTPAHLTQPTGSAAPPPGPAAT